jgi:hypothetical protein
MPLKPTIEAVRIAGRVARTMVPLASCLLYCCPNALRAESLIIHLRLSTTLTTYHAKAGDRFEAVLTAPAESCGRVLIPSGTVVHGTVSRAKRVGMGLWRERAALDLDFQDYELADGRRFPFEARLQSIDNARETVNGNGRIKGILAADNPQSFISGVWYMPKANMFYRSVIGLTGASGRIWTQYSMGPMGAMAMFGLKAAMFRLPEPEIRLPAGAEMRAVVTSFASEAPRFDAARELKAPARLSEWIQRQPVNITKAPGQEVEDIINVVFMASRGELKKSFEAAGWTEPDRFDRRSAGRFYKAYASGAGYASAPVSRLYYEDREPDLVMQKSFNTLAKRHHIRLWRAEADGQEVWLGAATEDVGITFNKASMLFTHRIDREIDRERTKVVNDLDFAGCSTGVAYVDRENLRSYGEEKSIITDGRAALLKLGDCSRVANAMTMPHPPGTKFTRSIRRVMLETRNYFVRGNAYYWAYRGYAKLRTNALARNNQSVP